MLLSELYKIMVKKLLSQVLGGVIAPIAPPWIRPCVESLRQAGVAYIIKIPTPYL